MLVEVIVTSLVEAIKAQELGAHRLELIHGFELGGLSPSLKLAEEICAAVSIPVNVMVRPHGNGFVYNAADLSKIQREIDFLASKTRTADIVFGSLTTSNRVDCSQLELVLRQLEGSQLGMTFHRALDESQDILADFSLLQQYAPNGLKRVLSSGGQPTALAGKQTLAQMQQIAVEQVHGVSVLAGSGIQPTNVVELIRATKVNQIHLGTGLRRDNKLQAGLFFDLFTNLALANN